jgi:hypothetical protein
MFFNSLFFFFFSTRTRKTMWTIRPTMCIMHETVACDLSC